MFVAWSVATIYAAWAFTRSFLHHGWWLVTSVYLVSEAALTPFELVFLGTAQGLTVLAAEVPAGVFADAYSRKRSLVVAHALMGLGMLATGFVLSFSALLVTQVIWGLSWTFSSGADVAWMTDELRAPERVGEALLNAARWGHAGSALGILCIGALAWASSLAVAMIAAGAGMWLLGIAVALVFRETNFQRAAPGKMLATAVQTLRSGLLRIRFHRILVHILVCTLLINGADEGFGRLYVKRLLDIGLPDGAPAVVWLTGLAIACLALSLVALAAVSRFLQRNGEHSRAYSVAAAVGGLALALFAAAHSIVLAAFAVLLVAGIATSALRTVSVVWANQHATSQLRATVQSFLSVAENIGEVGLGFLLAVVASYGGISAAMVGGSAIFALVVVLVERRSRQA